MDALATLASVALGGLLVLLSDVVRRKVEWKRDQVENLVESGVHLIALHHRAAGDLMEWRSAADPPGNIDAGKGERLDAIVRFFAMPGSEFLGNHYIALRESHRNLRRSFGDDERWVIARGEYMAAVRDFELALQAIRATGRLPAGALPEGDRRQLEEYRLA
jgi:hypothetical protein